MIKLQILFKPDTKMATQTHSLNTKKPIKAFNQSHPHLTVYPQCFFKGEHWCIYEGVSKSFQTES